MSNLSALNMTGVREIDAKLEGLEKKTAKKIARASINAGLGEMRKEIRKRAPTGKTKVLKKSIGNRFRKKKRTELMEAVVGINVGKTYGGYTKSGKKKKANVARHGHLVALGTNVRQNKSGANRGTINPNDFVRQGTEAAMPSVKTKMIAKSKQVLEKELAKI